VNVPSGDGLPLPSLAMDAPAHEPRTPLSPLVKLRGALGYPPPLPLLARGAGAFVLLFVPVVVARLALPPWAERPAALSLVAAAIALAGSRAFVVGLQAALTLLAGAAVAFAGHPWVLTALVAVACAIGARANRTHSGAFATAPLVVASLGWSPPGASLHAPPIAVGAVLAASMLWGLACLELVRVRRPARPSSVREAEVYASTVPLVVTVLTAIAAGAALPHGAWLVGTTALLARPEVDRTRARTVQRAVGTVVGVTLAAVVAPLGHAAVLLAAFVCAAHMAAYAFAGDYLRQTAFSTPYTLLMIAAAGPHAPWSAFAARLAWNLLAALVAVAIAARQFHALRQIGAEAPTKVG
jgi:Fusaric acid resistance protein-like